MDRVAGLLEVKGRQFNLKWEQELESFLLEKVTCYERIAGSGQLAGVKDAETFDFQNVVNFLNHMKPTSSTLDDWIW